MKVKIVKAVRVAGKEYYPSNVAEFEEPTARRLVAQGYGTEVLEAENREPRGISPAKPPMDFESVGDISEVLPTSGEGEQFSIEALVGVPVVIVDARFDKGQSGKLEGKDIATIQFVKRDGTEGGSPHGPVRLSHR